MKPSSSWQVPVFLLGLLMGTGSTLVMKALYETQGVDSYGVHRTFEKPLFITFTMFCGMVFALPLHYWVLACQRKTKVEVNPTEKKPLVQYSEAQLDRILADNDTTYQVYSDDVATPTIVNSDGTIITPHFDAIAKTDEQDDDVADADETHALDDPWALFDLRLNAILFIPAFFDLLGTALSTIGLLYTSVSVYQLSRCTVIIVTALLKAFVLGHPLSANMWAGVIVNAVAMAFVGSTAFFDSHTTPAVAEAVVSTTADAVGTVTATVTATAAEDAITSALGNYSDSRIGILFILASCLVQGAQYVFEEKVMSYDNVPPLILIGMEGFWGCALFLGFVFPLVHNLPGLDHGRYEDVFDSFVFCFTNGSIFALIFLFFIIVFLYNVFCIYITYLLNSVWHAIMDNCRPVAVWIAGLSLYYSIGKIGEPWSSSSWLEVAGMLLLFYGTAVYNGNLAFPGLTKDDTKEVEYEEAVVGHYNPNPSTPMFRPGTPKMSMMNEPSINHGHSHAIPSSHAGHGHSHAGGHGHSHAGGHAGHGHSHAGSNFSNAATLRRLQTPKLTSGDMDHAAILTQSPALVPRASEYSNIPSSGMNNI